MEKLVEQFLFALVVSVLTLSFVLVQSNAQVSIGISQKQNISRRETKLSEEVYQKCHSIMKHSRVFRNYTYEDTKKFLNEVLAFQAPDFLQNRFPYYHAGFDYEDRPVWIAEGGKFQMEDLVDRVFELFPTLETMAAQASINVAKSFVAREKERPGKDIRSFVGIMDCEGFDLRLAYRVLARPELIEFGIKLAELYFDLGESTVAQVIVLNANYAAKIIIDLSRPVVGALIDRLVVLGTNKYKWKAELRRHLPEESIPTWYGGPEGFKPLAVYA